MNSDKTLKCLSYHFQELWLQTGVTCKRPWGNKKNEFPLSHSDFTSPCFLDANQKLSSSLDSLSHPFLLSYSHHSSINMLHITQTEVQCIMVSFISLVLPTAVNPLFLLETQHPIWSWKFTQSFFFFMQYTNPQEKSTPVISPECDQSRQRDSEETREYWNQCFGGNSIYLYYEKRPYSQS